MLQDNDIVMITDHQTVTQQNILNTFFYIIQVITAGITILDLLLEFRDVVVDGVEQIQNQSVEHIELEGRNLTDPLQVDLLATGTFGQDVTGGAVMPSYVAAGFKFGVGSTATRPGGKRIAGIGEDHVTGNTYNPEGQSIVDVITAMEQDLEIVGAVAGEGAALPVIVGRNLDGSFNLLKISLVTEIISSGSIRSQVSRRAPVT